MKVIGWKAWYTNDRQYNSIDHNPKDLPDTGLLFIKEFGDNGRYFRVLDGGDWYYYEDGRWHRVGSDSWDGWVDPPAVKCDKCLKRGDGVSDKMFSEMTELVWESEWP